MEDNLTPNSERLQIQQFCELDSHELEIEEVGNEDLSDEDIYVTVYLIFYINFPGFFFPFLNSRVCTFSFDF